MLPALLIAAGASRRMGRPKQLLPWGTGTLIEHQIATLQNARLDVTVILGAHAERIIPVLRGTNASVHVFNHWQGGMGASIAYGVQQLSTEEAPPGILIALVDQPLVGAAHLLRMTDAFQPGSGQIIGSRSPVGITGPPVLFDARYLPELSQLNGDQGAKPLLRKYPERTQWIISKNGLKDMDTLRAYKQLKQHSGS